MVHIVAIKCLDEGENIPSIKSAFILASTTNPKEYIQRRGRVLRKSPETGKEYAEIFDFVTLPRPLDEVSGLTEDQMKRDLSLVKNELRANRLNHKICDESNCSGRSISGTARSNPRRMQRKIRLTLRRYWNE